MSPKNNVSHLLGALPTADIEGFDQLVELALNLRWSWNHTSDEIWSQLDPALWERTHNPWLILKNVSPNQINKILNDPTLRKKINNLIAVKNNYVEGQKWFQKTYPNVPLKCIAYFCMEYMLSEALPIYSGGLGNVAGDQLKAASDLGVPVIAIGLLYQEGYFRQIIDKNCAQVAFFPTNNPGQLPITPLRSADGEWLHIKLDLPHLPIWLRVWEVHVGCLKLYLLDSNAASNYAPYRAITAELYGGDQHKRLMQELILGLGGWKLLTTLGIEPEVCHLNEGHAAFAVLARAQSFMQKTNLSFEAALAVTRMGNLFTTHTAVKAGFDLFDPMLVDHYLGDYAENKLGISRHDLFALGRCDPQNINEKFNMAYLAIRGSGSINGVSQLHKKVSQQLFAELFPRWPVDEVPVKSVTNGVHTPSWDSAIADDLWTKACGKSPWLFMLENTQNIYKIPDKEIWKMRDDSRKVLVEFVYKHIALQCEMAGESESVYNNLKLNPNALTLGFARRFATYKRSDLLLHDTDRLLRILSNPQRPVQLVISGKAHPADLPGQALIQKWIKFIRRPEVQPYIIFLTDYDMLLTEKMVQGVDVWLNTPRRPWEACGTSGMKVLVNGGLNLSELDGWWVEAYTPEVGWALGDGQEHGDSAEWDAKEADELYTLLENQVIPEFYTRNKAGLSEAWVTRIRKSMAELTHKFSANRAVREYVETQYLPAAKSYLERANNKGAIGDHILHWRQELNQKWNNIRFGELNVKSDAKQHIFEIPVYCHALDPIFLRVELYANGKDKSEPVRLEMTRMQQKNDPAGCYIYTASVPNMRAVDEYTVRILPFFNSVALSIPLEAGNILWQR